MMTFCDVSVSVVSSWQARGQSLGRWNVSFTARWCDRRGPKRFQINRIWHLLVLSGRQVPARVPRAEAAATHRMSVLEVAEDHSVHWLRVDGDHRVGGLWCLRGGHKATCHASLCAARQQLSAPLPFPLMNLGVWGRGGERRRRRRRWRRGRGSRWSRKDRSGCEPTDIPAL